MAMTAADVIERVTYVLSDDAHIRWTLDELLLWITDAMREIGVRKPLTMSRTKVLTLVAGSRQAISDDAMRLLDVTRNIGADGMTPGYSITVIDRPQMDAQVPDWHMAKQSGRIKHVTYDGANDSLGFFVYPPAKEGTKIEVIDAARPAPISSQSDALPVKDEYMSAIVSFVLYRALSKESEDGNGQLAAAHFSAFTNALGDTAQSQAAAQTAGV